MAAISEMVRHLLIYGVGVNIATDIKEKVRQ